MHQQLIEICSYLDEVSKKIAAHADSKAMSIQLGNGTFPGLNKNELAEVSSHLSALIKERGLDDLGTGEKRISNYKDVLIFLRDNTVPQMFNNNSGPAIAAYLFTIAGLEKAVQSALQKDPSQEIQQSLSKSRKAATAIAARVKDLNERIPELDKKIEKIEDAYESANQLPTDLDELANQKQKMEDLVAEAVKAAEAVTEIHKKTDGVDKKLVALNSQAEQVLEKCGRADAADTSQGLAKAFDERSKALNISMRWWVVGLVIALIAGGLFGHSQLQHLLKLLESPPDSVALIWGNIIMAVVSIGAPLWFAFLAQKQIGFKFRLAEDYAYKASISSAYEGYRQEAARMDKDLEIHLLASALSRLDEVPLRLVEPKVYGSPLQELLDSENVHKAAKSIPGFIEGLGERIQQFTDNAIIRDKTPKEFQETNDKLTQKEEKHSI